MMEYQMNSVQQYEQNKVIRIDCREHCQAAYFEVHSQKFECLEKSELTPQLLEVAKYYSLHARRYLKRRHFLFKKFDEGVKFDEESLYSIIPEDVSEYLKVRMKETDVKKICEPFAGVGGIAVHLCGNFDEYVVNDIDKSKINKLKHNITVYGKKEYLVKDYSKDFLEMENFCTDVMIVCPPWGGIDVTEYSKKDLDQIMKPTLTQILIHSSKFSKNMLLQMPKNTNIDNFVKILLKSGVFPPIFTIQKIYRNDKVQQLFIYLGDPKFVKINSHVFQMIYRDVGIEQLQKKAKKKVKEEIRNNLMIFMNRIYVRYHPHKKEGDQQSGQSKS